MFCMLSYFNVYCMVSAFDKKKNKIAIPGFDAQLYNNDKV